MGRTFHLCTITGIPLKAHWSFGLTLLFVAYVVHLHNLTAAASIGFILLVLVMFVCVILHEFGHSMAARRYSIETLDIIISPIGGLARLQDIPEEPQKELVVAPGWASCKCCDCNNCWMLPALHIGLKAYS